jgi:hypothetical protein
LNAKVMRAQSERFRLRRIQIMGRTASGSAWGLVLLAVLLAGCGLESWAATGEESLLMLHNGGCVCGIMPQIGGRVVVFRTETGDNVLDARPELWKDAPPLDLLATTWKQYYGESVWSGPQADWWTARQPYPPKVERKGTWPPDPAWELAPFTVVEKTSTRVVMRSPVSLFTGLELTKTVELSADGRLKLQVDATNRGDRVVTRDLWLLHRVLPTARCFLPLKSETADKGFAKAALSLTVEGLTVLEPLADKTRTKPASGKIGGVPEEGWMAAATPGAFFTVRFQAADASKVAPGQAPVEVFFSSAPEPLCEMEHHGELTTLKPGEKMESKEVWQIVPYAGPDNAEAQARFLRTEMGGP